ncbi:mgtE, partial [Symbiodinium microadriaticum]
EDEFDAGQPRRQPANDWKEPAMMSKDPLGYHGAGCRAAGADDADVLPTTSVRSRGSRMVRFPTLLAGGAAGATAPTALRASQALPASVAALLASCYSPGRHNHAHVCLPPLPVQCPIVCKMLLATAQYGRTFSSSECIVAACAFAILSEVLVLSVPITPPSLIARDVHATCDAVVFAISFSAARVPASCASAKRERGLPKMPDVARPEPAEEVVAVSFSLTQSPLERTDACILGKSSPNPTWQAVRDAPCCSALAGLALRCFSAFDGRIFTCGAGCAFASDLSAARVSPEPIICRAGLPTVGRQLLGTSHRSRGVEQSPAEDLLLCCNEIALTFTVFRVQEVLEALQDVLLTTVIPNAARLPARAVQAPACWFFTNENTLCVRSIFGLTPLGLRPPRSHGCIPVPYFAQSSSGLPLACRHLASFRPKKKMQNLQVDINEDAVLEDARRAATRARDVHAMPVWRRAWSRMLALLLTFIIELVVAFFISAYQDTFKRYTLLISFQPVISALSGNVGLQTMATITAGLPLGLFNGRHIGQGLWHELLPGLLIAVLLSTMVGGTALFWYALSPAAGHTVKGAVAFGFAIFLGQFASSLSATLTASLAPLLFNRCSFNPASMGGPFETAFQDIIGSSVVLAAAGAVLMQYGDHAEACPGGDVKACALLCGAGGSYNEQCLQHCLDLAMQGLC